MPLTLEVPITIRIAGNPGVRDLTAVERGAGDVTLQALVALRDGFVTPRGRRRAVVVSEPTVEFTHPEVVGGEMGSAVRSAIQAGIRYGIAVSGIDRGGAAFDPRRAGREPFDPLRMGATGYRIPVFDDGTEHEIAVDTPLDIDLVIDRAWRAHVARFGAVWDPARFGYPGFYGSFILDGRLVRNELVYIMHVNQIDEDGNLREWQWQRAQLQMFSYNAAQDEISEGPLTPAMGHYVLTTTEEPATFENLQRLTKRVAEQEPDQLPQEVLNRMAEQAADPNALIFTMRDGESTHLMAIVPGVPGRGGVAHSPIRFIAEGQDLGVDGTGSGRKASAGDGPRAQGGPLGDVAEGAGSIWPVIGLGGDQLVCEPYLGEPALTSLARGSEALEHKIRDIASQLELDYCGYAGKFCLNAADVIGARAHAVGVTSANSMVTTVVEVRPDGGGNHGFVNLRPGDAAELQYMQALGDLAVQVNQLANLIGTVYLLPENKQLIYWDDGRNFDPDAAAWLLRFWKGMDRLDRSCMWLFAETCRVILLQQLRSSRTGIEGRQQRFEEALTTFGQKLGIIGEGVVRMSVLRRAIGHADRYDITGSVRSVLSHQPPPRHYGHGEVVEVPAPIASIPARIVEVLNDATISDGPDGHIAHYANRNWTDRELEQAVAVRRGMLNATDPLFLQVANLDALYAGFQRDPATLRTYLSGLLAEMLRANTAMLHKAGEASEGAFFALEASQYVKAQGGINSRGLRYDLQGLHDLADQVLRPYAGLLDAYTTGIHRAIGIKAGWDDFLMIFSTVGIIALALLCAPLGTVVVGVVTGVAGLALTLNDLREADRLEDLYRSSEDPESILHWQDVELTRLMANLSVVFSIFDVVGVAKGAKAILSEARQALREVAEQGGRGVARTTLRASRDAVLRNMAGEVLDNAVKEAMQAAALMGAATLLLPVVVTPVLTTWIRGVAAQHGTLPEVEAVLRAAGRTDPPASVPNAPTGATP